MGLSDGRKSFPIRLAVLIQYQSVTASHPASQPPSHVGVAITLYAKASSLKITLYQYTFLVTSCNNNGKYTNNNRKHLCLCVCVYDISSMQQN